MEQEKNEELGICACINSNFDVTKFKSESHGERQLNKFIEKYWIIIIALTISTIITYIFRESIKHFFGLW